ncbi:hypothetical protein NQ647_04875 [Acinetobacter baumannii]|nr:hypothetical protein [Acinetobacter baumannii]
MDTAFDKQGRLINGEDLWELNGKVDKDGYYCIGCGVNVTPASYDRELNVQRPHFREHRSYPHKANCDVLGEDEIKGNGRKRKVFNPNDTLPSFIPTVLRLIDTNTAMGTDQSLNYSSSSIKGTNLGTERVVRRSHGVVQSIRRLCSVYIDYPYDRDIPLKIPNNELSTYGELFRKIPSDFRLADTSKILMSQMHFSRLDIIDNEIRIQLSQGLWGYDEKIKKERVIKNSFLIIDTSNWSKNRKTVITNELNFVRSEAIDAYNKNKKTKLKSWIFFIGSQDLDNPSIYRVSDHRLICAMSADNIL